MIHDAAQTTVTSVAAGTTVHDQATVTGAPGARPTGTVTFAWFTNGDLHRTGGRRRRSVHAGGRVVDATAFTQTPAVAGSFAFQAT